jgi:malonyl-CoA decarboxylase
MRASTRVSFFGDLVEAIFARGRRLIVRPEKMRLDVAAPAPDLKLLAEAILSVRGEASGVALADQLLRSYAASETEKKIGFLKLLREQFGGDLLSLDLAIAAYQKSPGPYRTTEIREAAEPRRQELIRRLNLAPGGTHALVKMRADLLSALPSSPELRIVDDDFRHLLSSWFNRGFLVLRPIDWGSPANILEKIIRYEAVHEIKGWEDLRNRLDPRDRKCFAFFHPALIDEPLIFVEVALVAHVPDAVAQLIAPDRAVVSEPDATTAVFYSISNCQKGLAGITFGNFLIKQVVEDLKRALPQLSTFVTLSPVPGFAEWLKREVGLDLPKMISSDRREALRAVNEPNWHLDEAEIAKLREPLLASAASYLLFAKTLAGKPLDPVARFHLGNGARLERINLLGDLSEKGLNSAYGVMVNYVYRPDEVEQNHEAFAEHATIAASGNVWRLADQKSTVMST